MNIIIMMQSSALLQLLGPCELPEEVTFASPTLASLPTATASSQSGSSSRQSVTSTDDVQHDNVPGVEVETEANSKVNFMFFN